MVFKVTAIQMSGSQMSEFCLVVEFPLGGSATNEATSSSLNVNMLLGGLQNLNLVTSLGMNGNQEKIGISGNEVVYETTST